MTLPNPITYHVHTGDPLPETWPYAYVVAGDGLFKVAETPHWHGHIQLAATRVAGLPCLGGHRLTLRVPRIPARWLTAVLNHARRAGAGNAVLQPIEQLYHFHWFDDGRGWQVAIPKQDASAARISYRGGDAPTIALDLHSHHTMGAYFSAIDNRDEQGCRLYAVIGCIYTRPELVIRLGIHGDFCPVDPLCLFEGLGPFIERRSNHE